MKIKTKKQMNLPQLIKWAEKNDVRSKSYYGDRYEDRLFFNENQDVICDCIPINETFTVEVEETVTEETEFEILYYMTFLGGIFKSIYPTIKSTLEHSLNEPIALYILNDDLKMTLIWHDGKLVE